MTLIALTNANQIATAFQLLSQQLQNGAQPYARHVNWPGPDPGGDLTVHWHSTNHLWALADEVGGHHPGYWFGFGTVDPSVNTVLAPEMQLGLNREGTGRRCAGVFARHNDGRVFAMHKGRFQLNQRPISPAAFRLAHPHLPTENVQWPHALENYFILGELTNPGLVTHIAAFVNTVVQYKNTLRAAAQDD